MTVISPLNGVGQILCVKGHRLQPLLVSKNTVFGLPHSEVWYCKQCSRAVKTMHFENIRQMAARRTCVLLLSHPLGSYG